MIFNTVSYLVFLTLAVAVFWLLPQRHRIWLLLGASLLFYGLWRWEFVALIVLSAFVDYYFSLKIHAETDATRRFRYLLTSITINLALLVYFKYTYFIIDNISLIPGVAGSEFKASIGNIILPLGISFYTFLSISYTIDIYRREFTPIRDFTHYLTYVMFWPHMIAGPILRANELLPQLLSPPTPTQHDIAAGMRAIIFGLLLKVGLADHMAPIVDDAFRMSPKQLGGIDVWTMAFAFGLQIYFDFAGYSMIAIGSARLLGIIFPQNFDWPYMATSPRDFWRRWHITLSSWIRDYLYLPLSGLRDPASGKPVSLSHSSGGIDIQFVHTRKVWRVTAALFLAWLIMGLWHGASWNFALWGLWHAAFIFIYRLLIPFLPDSPGRIGKFFGWGITVLIAMLGWIPFRAPNVETTFSLWGRLLDLTSYRSLAFRENSYLVVFVAFVGMVLLYAMIRMQPRGDTTASQFCRASFEVGALAASIFVVFIFLRPVAQFIYFQF